MNAPAVPSPATTAQLGDFARQAVGVPLPGQPAAPATPPVTTAPATAPAKTGDSPVPTDILPGHTQTTPDPTAPDAALTAAIDAEVTRLNLGKDQSAAFRAMRIEQEKIKAVNADLTSKLTEAEKLKLRIAPLEQLQEQVDFATSRRFQEQFQAPFEQSRNELLTALKPFGLTEQDYTALKDADWKKRTDLMKGKVPAGSEALVVQLFTQHDQRYGAMKTALSDATKDGTKWRDTVKTERLAKADTVLQSVRDRLLKANHFALNDSKADPNYLKSLMTKAQQFYTDDVSDEHRAEAALKAATSDTYHALYINAVKQIQQITQERDQLISGRRAAGPGGQPPVPQLPGNRTVPDGASLSDIARMAVGG